MAFFEDKTDMFKHRAERFGRQAEDYLKKGKTEKANWAKEQEKENRDKAEKYKGQKGWK